MSGGPVAIEAIAPLVPQGAHVLDLGCGDGALLLLSEIVRDGNAGLCDDTLVMAGECGRTDADSLRQCYYMIAKREYRPQPLRLASSAPLLNYDPSLTAYDGLTGGAKNA